MAEDMAASKPAVKAFEPLKRPKSRVLRFLGINPYLLKDFIPSGKTAAYLTVAASPIAFYLYDRQRAEEIKKDYTRKVQHLADAPVPSSGNVEADDLEFPRKVWIMSTRVPDDHENDRANRWFKNYIQPVLYAAGYDYSFLNGTAPGALGRRVRDKIRLDRIANLTPQPKVQPGEAGYTEYLDKRRFAEGMGLTVVVGRNTLKEYLWGLKEGWLRDFDAVEEERGDEGRLQDLREELAKDGKFDEEPRNLGISELGDDSNASTAPTIPPSTTSRPNLMPNMSSFSFYDSPKPSSATSSANSADSNAFKDKSLLIAAASDIPVQPPMLFLPFDHPLGYLRYWPIKMFKYLFFERYRVQQGCETALSIVQAIHPSNSLDAPFLDEDASRRGLRSIQKPKDTKYPDGDKVPSYEELEQVLTENKKKLNEAWKGYPPPESGSKDVDTGLGDEYHYRKSFSETPSNIVSARREYYNTLPGKLRIARELERRDRLPTKEEQKYPPPTEQELVEERLAKEQKWRKDFQGWLVTRVGSKVPWDSRFEAFRVLDLDMAKANRERYGHVADQGGKTGSAELS